jgi:hypothetical protein
MEIDYPEIMDKQYTETLFISSRPARTILGIGASVPSGIGVRTDFNPTRGASP